MNCTAGWLTEYKKYLIFTKSGDQRDMTVGGDKK